MASSLSSGETSRGVAAVLEHPNGSQVSLISHPMADTGACFPRQDSEVCVITACP